MLVGIMAVIPSCQKDTPVTIEEKPASLPTGIASFHVGSKGRTYSGKNIPNKIDFLKALDKDIDSAANDRKPFSVTLRFVGIGSNSDGVYIGNELHQNISIAPKGNRFVITFHEGPFQTPTKVAEFTTYNEALNRLKQKTMEIYDINQRNNDLSNPKPQNKQN